MEKACRFSLLALLIFGGAFFVYADEAEITVHSIPKGANVRINGRDEGVCPLLLIEQTGATIQIEVYKRGIGSAIINYPVKGNDTVIMDLRSGRRISGKEYRQYLKRSKKKKQKKVEPTPVPEGGVSVMEPTPSSTVPDEVVPATIVSVPREIPLPTKLGSRKVSGLVQYKININHRGSLLQAEVLQPDFDKDIDGLIKKWIRLWKFHPGKLKGFPVVSDLTVTIRYDLAGGVLGVEKHGMHTTLRISGTQGNAREGSGEKIVPSTPVPTPSPKKPARVKTVPTTFPQKVVPSATPVRVEPSATPKRAAPTPTSVPVAEESAQLPAVDCADKNAVSVPPEILQPPKIGAIPVAIQNLNIKGDAVFKVLIDASGRVAAVETVTKPKSDKLEKWLLPIIRNTEWTPAKSGGKPISCWRKLKVSYYTLACKFDFVDIYD